MIIDMKAQKTKCTHFDTHVTLNTEKLSNLCIFEFSKSNGMLHKEEVVSFSEFHNL